MSTARVTIDSLCVNQALLTSLYHFLTLTSLPTAHSTLVFGLSPHFSENSTLWPHYEPSLQRWKRDKSLSFVPPDGRFTLMDYRFAPSGSATSTTAGTGATITAARGDIVPLPLMLKATIEVNEFGGM